MKLYLSHLTIVVYMTTIVIYSFFLGIIQFQIYVMVIYLLITKSQREFSDVLLQIIFY